MRSKSTARGFENYKGIDNEQAAAAFLAGTCGLVAMTSAQHAEGRQFDPGQVYLTRMFDTPPIHVEPLKEGRARQYNRTQETSNQERSPLWRLSSVRNEPESLPMFHGL